MKKMRTFPRADLLVSEERRFLDSYCPTLMPPAWNDRPDDDSLLLTFVAFTGLANHANRTWLNEPGQFAFDNAGITLSQFNAQLHANRQRERSCQQA